MPNPKAGTVTPDVGKAVTDAKAGKIEYRLDKQNIIHVPIGKASFGAEKLMTNLDTVLDAIAKAKPAAAKASTSRALPSPPPWAPAFALLPISTAYKFFSFELERLTNARSRAILIKLFLRQQVPQGITGFTHLPRNVRLIAMLSSPFPATEGAFFCISHKKPLTETNL